MVAKRIKIDTILTIKNKVHLGIIFNLTEGGEFNYDSFKHIYLNKNIKIINSSNEKIVKVIGIERYVSMSNIENINIFFKVDLETSKTIKVGDYIELI